MDRWTYRDANGVAHIRPDIAITCAVQVLAEYEDSGFTPEEIARLQRELESGRLVRLPCAVGQIVFVPTDDGGMYAPYVKGIAFVRSNAPDAVMRAEATVGIDRERLNFMIAPENRGTYWFETEEAARAALEGRQTRKDAEV